MKAQLEFSRKMIQAYNEIFKPLCHKVKLSQTASMIAARTTDILLFLANNPEFKTARDIVEIRHIKANLVSMNVDKLVSEGYLERRSVEGDRRKTELVYTEKALPVIEEGRRCQEYFGERLLINTDEQSREIFFQVMEQMEENLDEILGGTR